MPQVSHLRGGLRESPPIEDTHDVDEAQPEVSDLLLRIHPLYGSRETHGPPQKGLSAHERLHALFARGRRQDVSMQSVRQDILRLTRSSHASHGGAQRGER